MDRESALLFLGTPATGTNQPAAATVTSQTPFTIAAAEELNRTLGPAAGKEEAYIKRTEEPGVPLDVSSGGSPWERFNVSLRREKENQVSYLQGKYGADNVRADERGDLIVRVLDSQTQKPKDVLLDEHDMSAKDLIDVAGQFPEIAAGIVAGRGSAGLKTAGGMFRNVVAASAGAEVAGAAQDVAANVTDFGEMRLGDVAKERALMFGGDIAVGSAFIPVAKVFQFMGAPLHGNRGPVQFDLLAAKESLEKRAGVKIPLTVGESTGSPLFSRAEAFVEKQPGGSMPFVEFRREQEGVLRRLQAFIMGKEPVTDEELGKNLTKLLQPGVGAAEKGVTSAQRAVQASAEKEIASILAKLTIPERRLYRAQAGKQLRDAIIAKRDLAKAEADNLFSKVRDLPGGEGAVFDAADLQSRFSEILKQLPSPESVVEVPTGILGPNGVPIMRTEKGEKVLKEFVPPNVLARLQAVTGMKDAKFSLSDLQQMRREVYDDIAKGEGVPGLGTHYLNDIGKAITGAIESGIEKLPDDALKQALLAANKHYKEKVVPFNRIGITELFRSPYDPGNLTDAQVIGRIFSGERSAQNYQLVKEVLGDKSPEFLGAKRAIADQLLENSKVPGEDLIDSKSFIRTLTNFRNEHREIADDIFGKDISKLIRESKFINYSATGDAVPEAELAKLLASGSPTAKQFQQLLLAQGKRDAVYRNEILKMVSEGKLDKVNASELVGKFLNSDSVSPAQVKEVMASVLGDAKLTEDVQAKMIENIFRGAARTATPADINRLLSGDPTRLVSGTGIFKQLESPAVREKVETVLGKDKFKDLLDYVRVEAARELKESSFKSAGGIAAGAQIASITKRGPLQYLDSAVKNWIVAKTLTNDRLRNWLTKIPSTDPASVSVLMASVPFVQAVAREYGSGDAADSVMKSIKSSIDRWSSEKAEGFEKQESEVRRQRFEQFLQSGKGSLEPTPTR